MGRIHIFILVLSGYIRAEDDPWDFLFMDPKDVNSEAFDAYDDNYDAYSPTVLPTITGPTTIYDHIGQYPATDAAADPTEAPTTTPAPPVATDAPATEAPAGRKGKKNKKNKKDKKEKSKDRNSKPEGNCPPIAESADLEWQDDILSHVDFSGDCDEAAHGQKCRVKPQADSDCNDNAKGSVWVQFNNNMEWVKTKGFKCALDPATNELRWVRRQFKKPAQRAQTRSAPNHFGSYKIKCGPPGCNHPAALFDNHPVALKDEGKKGLLDDPEANINYNRNGHWNCVDEDGESIDSDAEYIPRGGKCQLKCLNTFVPDLKSTITCKDNRNKNPDYAVGDWDGMRRLYKQINLKKYSKKAEFKRMAFSDGTRSGWRCYKTQPIYDEWSSWDSCVDGQQTRTRACEGTCDDTTENQDC